MCNIIQYLCIETFLAVQWLGPYAFNAGGAGLIPGQGIKILHAVQCEKKLRKYLCLLQMITVVSQLTSFYFGIDFDFLLHSSVRMVFALFLFFENYWAFLCGIRLSVFWMFHVYLKRNCNHYYWGSKFDIYLKIHLTYVALINF